jgi:hypothetical protein
MADAWTRGQVPIAVPRLRRLGEVVDDHQVDFCRKLAALGSIRLAEDPVILADLLDEAIRDLAPFRVHGPSADVDAAVARFGALVDELITRPRSRLPLFYRARPTRRRPKAGDDRTGRTDGPLPGQVPAGNTEHRSTRPRTRVGRAGGEQG